MDGHGLRSDELVRELPAGAVSPNGRYILTYESAGGFENTGMGGHPTIAALLVNEREGGKLVAQFRGADPIAQFEQSWAAAGDAQTNEPTPRRVSMTPARSSSA